MEYFDTDITENEKAIFAYLRVANINPDYDLIIKNSEQYLAKPKKYRDNFLLKETLRLGHGYGHFDPDKDLLDINASVSVKFTTDEEGKHKVMFTFFQSSKAYTPTFDYPYIGEEKIIFIVNRLASFSNIDIPDHQFELIKMKALANDNEWFQGFIDIKVKASSAEKIELDNDDRFKERIMYGEIAYIKCSLPSRGDTGVMLWDWVAPWYEKTLVEENIPEDKKYPHPFDLFKK